MVTLLEAVLSADLDRIKILLKIHHLLNLTRLINIIWENIQFLTRQMSLTLKILPLLINFAMKLYSQSDYNFSTGRYYK